MNTIRKILTILTLLSAILIFSCNKQVNQIKDYNTVSYFGAQGDSITDDTKAIQKAVDSGIGQIVFPSGEFRITKSIEIDLNKNGKIIICGFGTAKVIMEGAGPAFKFIGTHTGTASPATIKYNVEKNQLMPLVDGLEIVGKHSEAVGIEAAGTMGLIITRVQIQKALHGIHLINRNRNVIISECHLYNNHGVGIYLDEVDLHQINITNCHISYNGGGGVVVRKGSVRNLQIGSCDIEGNMNPDGPPAANVLIDITEGSMREGAITGCTLQHGHNTPESSNIRFIGNGSEIRHKTGYFTIADNIISDTQQNLHIKYGRGIIITGNAFGEGFPFNILVEHSDHIVFGTNLLDRNPDYPIQSRNLNDPVTSNNSVLIRDSHNITINGLHVNNATGGPAAIVLERCHNYNLMNSTILNCDGAGILLKNTEKGKVSNNFIDEERSEAINPIAINVQGGRDNLIINNFTRDAITTEYNTARVIENYTY